MSEKSVCLCFDLRSGSLAIGITLLVLGGLITFGGFICIGALEREDRGAIRGYGDFHQYQNCDELIMLLQCVMGILLVIFNSLLIYGVVKKRTGMLLAWLIYYGIFCSIKTVVGITSLVFAMLSGKTLPVAGACVELLVAVLFWRYEGFHRYQYDELKIMLLYQAVIGILFLIFNSLLIHGVRKRKTGMVLAWLIYHGVYSSIKTVALMIGLAFAMASGKPSQKVGVAVGFLETILFWMLLLFVRRYRTSLKQQTGESHMPQKDEDVENMTKVQV